MSAFKAVILPVIAEHADEAGFLWMQRRRAVQAPSTSLRQLARHDERLAAHLDGIRLAKGAGETACTKRLVTGEPGSMFVATLVALESGVPERLEHLLALCEAIPGMQSGLFAALGWSEAHYLRGSVARLLKSDSPFRRLAGTVACAMHRVDPGLMSSHLIDDPDAKVRARALRTVGELGRHELVSRLAATIADDDPACQFWAAWSAVLMGDRQKAHEMLLNFGLNEGAERLPGFPLALMSIDLSGAHGVLRQLSQDSGARRRLIGGTGFVGDPYYVSWLISEMKDDKTARLAGESFSLITGTDLTSLNLRRKQSEIIDPQPNDNPDDPNVDMDPDDGLPWPDAERISRWWKSNKNRFESGTRYFLGAPLTRENCLRVLKDGFQRQRILAAHYLCLLEPGTVLFEWRAPAFRQQRLLASMV